MSGNRRSFAEAAVNGEAAARRLERSASTASSASGDDRPPLSRSASASSLGGAGAALTVTTAQGVLRGRRARAPSGAAYCAFQGIPYAKPPVRELRFKPPQPAEKWTSIRNATEEGPVAPQVNLYTGRLEGDEDCLYLNVYTPNPPKGSMPVMVWIHGGGFFSGSGNADIHGPEYLVEHGVVVVTFNYRLGVLGFMSTGDNVVPGNMGLKDQVMALRWVKDHIANFGGDPKNVTIFGQDAGAWSCHAHMLSPMSRGLFQRVIAMSGSTLVPAAFSTAVPERTFVLTEHLGLRTRSSEEVLMYLMEFPAKAFVEDMRHALAPEDKERTVIPFVMTVEPPDAEGGAFLTKPPAELLRAGRAHRVPLLTGVTALEGAVFLVKNVRNVINATANLDMSFQRLVPQDFNGRKEDRIALCREMKNFYYGDEPVSSDNLGPYVNIRGDLAFNYPVIKTARIHSKQTQNVYLYLFSADGELNHMKRIAKAEKLAGACHGDDVFYLFRSSLFDVAAEPTSAESKTIANLTKLWTNFAKTGNPTPDKGGDLGVTWPAFSERTPSYLRIDNSGVSVAKELFGERMAFWDRLYERLSK
ncbi:juvenile hormone esterase-like [Schistocerca gregaria]|uniref:juvenile hormone esterase-like n=1 Tax=Schistocerca gregaria TaxID=7010 RepID=UPI00211F194A|nr:juvenile hormone esterase-like [Schistocerca gregaria]